MKTSFLGLFFINIFVIIAGKPTAEPAATCNFFEPHFKFSNRPSRAAPLGEGEHMLQDDVVGDSEAGVIGDEVTDDFDSDGINSDGEQTATQENVVQDDAGRLIIHCKPDRAACYTAWRAEVIPNTNGTRNIIIHAGCWVQSFNGSGSPYCKPGVCENSDRPTRNDTRFCCCTGAMCNVNFTDVFVPPLVLAGSQLDEATRQGKENGTSSNTSLVVGLAIGVSALLLGAITFYIFKHCRHQPTKLVNNEELKSLKSVCQEFPGRLYRENPALNLDCTKVGERLAHGRYGEVFRATVDGQTVAVKKFSAENRDYFLNECRVYNLPHMQDHDALLRFLAATEQRSESGDLQYWLIVDYHPNRCLIEYLKQHALNSRVFTAMAQSVASGLAYLHTQFTKDGATKPGIVHRDFNSRNVLVCDDLRLCICDMGFALPLRVCDVSGGGRALEEPPTLNDVGTIRYMAPEVLEGSLNLRDSATALRQVDMYAFGLVLWEISTRCADLYQAGSVVPEYQLPFHKEVGHQPTFAQMQNLVARRKARPLFPEGWKENNSMVRFLRDTMDECWDADAEARLTANCVEERLRELPDVWGKQINVVETVGLLDYSDRRFSAPPPTYTAATGEPTDTMELVSAANATLVPPSKNVNEMMELFNNAAPVSAPPLSARMQPHQGRNPCQERNIKPESSEELTSSGNNLVDRKSRLQNGAFSSDFAGGNRNNSESTGNGLLGVRTSFPPPPGMGRTDGNNTRQKKVTNAAAEQRNRDEHAVSWFSRFRTPKKSMLLKNLAIQTPASNLPTTASANENKCNIRTAGLLPHLVRRDVPTDASNTTQVTCMSPSPSTSGSSPPRPTSQTRTPRFSLVHDSLEDNEQNGDDVLSRSPRSVLIDVDVASH